MSLNFFEEGNLKGEISSKKLNYKNWPKTNRSPKRPFNHKCTYQKLTIMSKKTMKPFANRFCALVCEFSEFFITMSTGLKRTGIEELFELRPIKPEVIKLLQRI